MCESLKQELQKYNDALNSGSLVIGFDGQSYFKVSMIRINQDGFFDAVPMTGHSWVPLQSAEIVENIPVEI